MFNSPKNGLELKANSIDLALESDFTFKYIISVKGQANIKISKINIDFEVDVGTQKANDTDQLAPKLTVSKVTIGINPDDVDIKLTGSGAVVRIASIFIPLIKSTILPEIVTQIESQVKTIVATTIDTDLADFGTHFTFPGLGGFSLDYAQLNGGPRVMNKQFAMDLNGTAYNANKIVKSKWTPPLFNSLDIHGKQVGGYISDYVLNTMFEAGFSTGYPLNITGVLDLLNITLTTTEIELILPGIVAKYGADQPVGLSVKFITAPSEIHFTAKDGGSGDISILLDWYVKGENAVHASLSHNTG